MALLTLLHMHNEAIMYLAKVQATVLQQHHVLGILISPNGTTLLLAGCSQKASCNTDGQLMPASSSCRLT